MNDTISKKTNNSKVRTCVLIAIYVALVVILGKVANFTDGNVKLTLKNLPIYVGAISLGSIPGALIGFLGELILQLTGEYGFTVTTLFWVLPQTILGAVCGLIFENNKVKTSSGVKFVICIIILQLFLTLLNTLVWCIDALVFGYFNYITLFGSLITRLMLAVILGIYYCFLIPVLVDAIKKIH